MLIKTLNIDPMGKPRILRGEQSKTAAKWRSWKQAIQLLMGKCEIPTQNFHLVFYLPMPKSWSKIKKAKLVNCPHQQKPDLDNLVKAVFDALYPDSDCQFWHFEATKLWAEQGRIEIRKI